MNNNLKEIRKVKKVTQKELSDFLGVSKAMVSMWENNANEKIPPVRIKQICDFFNIDEFTLFTSELDINQLKKSSEKEEFQKMIEKFTAEVELERLELSETLGVLHHALAEEIENMSDEPEKLEKVKRFSQIINNEELHKLFEHNIHPYALSTFLERFLILLEEKNPRKLMIIFMVIEYFVVLTPEGRLDKGKVKFSDNVEFLLKLEKFFN